MIPTRFLMQHHIVCLPESSPVSQAAHQMCSESIGCILVTDHQGHLVGIVTDRDLACIALGQKGSLTLRLSDVMTPHPLTVEKNEDIEHVVYLMEESGIRRIPVVERHSGGNQTCIGLISLDDLVTSKLIDYDHLSRVIRSQIERRHSIRYSAALGYPKHRFLTPHDRSSLDHFYHIISERTGISGDQLIEMTQIILSTLVRRLHYSGAAHFISLLPEKLQNHLLDLPPGPDQNITAATLKDEISLRYNLSLSKVDQIISRFFDGLSELISPEDLDYLRSALPEALKPPQAA